MNTPQRAEWPSTTHNWATEVDTAHVQRIRRDPETMAPGGLPHLILEVVAYAADEAEATGSGRCLIVLHPDGSVSVSDEGRGTDTRTDDRGRPIKKPIMSTKDLRFFDHPETQTLPDRHPRRGISVVSALSTWLVHTNRRRTGAWTQRYEHGIPVSDLLPVDTTGPTGTTVHFLPDPDLPIGNALNTPDLLEMANSWPHLSTAIDDARASRQLQGPKDQGGTPT
ncbi:hypothetical protein [Nocardia carnea]|uniref:hypothetical protein n=1 Tax=Nocardia carnea TaxID=37328 RepID=UPI0024557144|nr:hypothetical protein [Nocardia carnea]